MDPDLALVLGIILAAFSVPSILSALSDSRAPRASAITILIAGGLIMIALTGKPGGYQLADVPDVFVRVIGQYLR
ncbi:hypothetical protein [Sulfitobacter sp. S190]|uniref:hypothetical protein n=1 Tax=Sulfitobacter sp. S190 TaxID=2867022 RepID=UPI0021A5611F|nr:hypothetical protein [Sulfitobacter sp. S190]UWR22793.1 hypothetical protein K3756_01985 [Sulfitobacter sp. S190]